MRHDRKIIYLAGFLFAVPISLTSYINSTFLSSFINTYYTSLVYVVASLLTIVGLLQMPRTLECFGNRRTTFWLSLVMFVSLLMMSFAHSGALAVGGFILYWMSASFIIATLDIFVEDFSQHSSIGRFRGFYISIINIAWVISEIISGSIISKSSFAGIYLLSAFFMLLVALIFVFFLQNFKDPVYKEVPMGRTIRVFMQNKNISKNLFGGLGD